MNSSISKKVCGPKANKNHPEILSRKELDLLAKTKLGLSTKVIKSLTKEELCHRLGFSSTSTSTYTTTSASDCVLRSKKPLKDHQKKVVEFMKKNHGLVVFHKVGSGKTLTAISVSQCYLDEFPNHHVIVITPAGLLNNFKDEMENSYHNLQHKSQYQFYSYQTFMMRSKKPQTTVHCKNSLLIIDEVHNLRTPYHKSSNGKETGVMSKYIMNCAKSAHKVLLLTGTPLYNKPTDLVALYNFIHSSPTLVDSRSFKLSMMKCKISIRGGGHDTSNFPTRVDEDVFITMRPSYVKAYEEAIHHISGGASNTHLVNLYGSGNLESFYNGIRRAVNDLEDKQSGKVQWVVNFLKQHSPAEKTIIYSNFKKSGIHLIISSLPPNIQYAQISSEIPMGQRKKIVQDFNQNLISVLFITKAGGEGLDLKAVQNVILLEPTWNVASQEQIIGRAIRYQSHHHLPTPQKKVTVYHLYHVRPNDPALVKLKDYLEDFKKANNKQQLEMLTVPFIPYSNSFDLFMKLQMSMKQISIDKALKELESLSIENNIC